MEDKVDQKHEIGNEADPNPSIDKSTLFVVPLDQSFARTGENECWKDEGKATKDVVITLKDQNAPLLPRFETLCHDTHWLSKLRIMSTEHVRLFFCDLSHRLGQLKLELSGWHAKLR